MEENGVISLNEHADSLEKVATAIIIVFIIIILFFKPTSTQLQAGKLG